MINPMGEKKKVRGNGVGKWGGDFKYGSLRSSL